MPPEEKTSADEDLVRRDIRYKCWPLHCFISSSRSFCENSVCFGERKYRIFFVSKIVLALFKFRAFFLLYVRKVMRAENFQF